MVRVTVTYWKTKTQQFDVQMSVQQVPRIMDVADQLSRCSWTQLLLMVKDRLTSVNDESKLHVSSTSTTMSFTVCSGYAE